MLKTNCYCGSNKTFNHCCEPYIKGIQKPQTAETLMRSRFSAYASLNINYLLDTTHASQRKYYSKSDIQLWATTNQWIKLEIIDTTENTVTFKAYFLDSKLLAQVHHERSTFIFEKGSWFYVDGIFY
jgi:SEC-C motif domain protein